MNRSLILILLFCIPNDSHSVVIATGDSTVADTTFTTAAVSSAFHRPTQTLYVGLTNGAGDYAISKLMDSSTDLVPSFSAIGTNAAVTALYVDHLSLSTITTNVTQPYLIFTAEAAAATAATTFKVTDYAGGSYAATAAIEDANSATTGKILKLAATPTHVVTAVQANGISDSTFGTTAYDGLALTSVTRATTPTFVYYDATDGTTATPKALQIDAIAANAILGITNTLQADATTFFDMVYSDDLKRIYVSSLVTGPATDANDSAFGVAIIKVDPDANTLTKLNQCANQATVIDGNDRVVGFKGSADVVALRKLAVMKTSTGFYYLIVNGGASTDANTRNEVYAVALVSGNDSDLDGTFARNNDFTTATDFTTQASAAAHMPEKTDVQILVGGGVLPIVNSDADIFVSHMEVVGDTVYCAIRSDTVGTTNAPGIYYSQAIFNNIGKVARWTDWAKAAPYSLGNSATDGSTKAIAIDPVTGNSWGIETGGTVVRRTSWTQTGTGTTSLIAQLNSWFPQGCYSVYDLNQSIRYLGDVVDGFNRYAYFGGPSGKVVFTKISTGKSASFFAIQTDTTDYTAATAFLETTINGDSSPVTALGYSKAADGGNNGYFFAGTKNGFYAWAATTGGAGFDPDLYAELNAAPFVTTTHSWQKLSAISGHVKQIKSTNNQTYVLTRDVDRNNSTIADKVYRIARDQTTVTALNNNTVLLATSGTGSGTASDFTTAATFFDIFPMPSSADDTTDKLLLATNDGIFQSAAAVNADTTQTGATWTQVSNPATNNKAYDALTGPTHNRYESMAWSSDRSDDSTNSGTFTRSEWRQMVSSDTTTLVDLPNAQFCTDGTVITTVVPIKYLWSDGARRFFIGIPNNSDGRKNSLYILPYRVGTSDWNIAAEPGPISSTILNTQDRWHWVQAIGATGSIFAAGNKGVVSLE